MVTILNISFERSMACLELDDGRKIWISRSALRESGWGVNVAIDPEAFNRSIELFQYPNALNQAVSLLARRPYSKGEIERNLARHHYTREVIELVTYKLTKEKLLDDRDFSEIWVRNRSEKYGARRIRQELRVKGVPAEIAEEAVDRLSGEDELAAAEKHARKLWAKTRPEDDIRKARQRIISSLLRKGYAWEIAKQASDTAEGESKTARP